MPKLFSCYVFLLLGMYPSAIFGQNSSAISLQLLSSEQLKKDFQLLRTGLEKTHAGLYTYTSKDSLSKVRDNIELGLNQPMTSIDFYRQIAPLLKLIGNGHTNFFAPPDFMEAINTTQPRLPFAVHWYRDTLYVLRNVSDDETIEEGTIIKSINGESSIHLMQTFANNISRDGYNESKPEARVAGDFSGYYARFRDTPADFTIEIVDKNGANQTVDVEGQTTAKIITHAKKRYPNWRKDKGLPLQFSVDKHIGKLTIHSFSKPVIRKAKQSYKKFFKATFEQIKTQKIQHLIIDLRDNGGGYPEVVDELFSYLIAEPYTSQIIAHTITKNLPNQKHYKYGFGEFLEMRKTFKLKKEGAIYRITRNKEFQTLQPAKNSFQGKVYVLANPFTFSGATDFMGLLKNINLMPSLILPNTRIEAIIPLAHSKTINNFPDDGLGIAPDFFVKNSIEDVLEGKDAALKFTLELINAPTN